MKLYKYEFYREFRQQVFDFGHAIICLLSIMSNYFTLYGHIELFNGTSFGVILYFHRLTILSIWNLNLMTKIQKC